jgi:hypothetical protein
MVLMDLDSNRTFRLARRLLGSNREGVHYDVATKERLIFKNRSKALEKYRGNGNIFGSFTAIHKLGVNPQTTYNTPVGIYSYPIDFILDQVKEDVFDVPFASGQPYLHIFSVANLDKALNFDKNDTAKINAFNAEAPDDFESEEYNTVKSLVLKINDYVNSTIDEIPAHYWESSNQAAWNEWFNNLKKATGFEPDPDDTISYIIINTGGLDRYHVDKIFRKNRFPLEKVLENIQDIMARLERAKMATFPYEDRIMELPEVEAMIKLTGLKGYAEFKANMVLGEGERVECDQAFAWNMTRHLCDGNPKKWTGLMRRIGLIGAVDHNTGTIHPNEPHQAIFFDPSSIKVLEVIPNISSETYSLGRKFSTWAADVEKHMQNAVNSLRLHLRRFLASGNEGDRGTIFATLSWLKQHGREESEHWNYAIIKDLIYEIDNKREKSQVDPRAVDKIIQTLERFLE